MARVTTTPGGHEVSISIDHGYPDGDIKYYTWYVRDNLGDGPRGTVSGWSGRWWADLRREGGGALALEEVYGSGARSTSIVRAIDAVIALNEEE